MHKELAEYYNKAFHLEPEVRALSLIFLSSHYLQDFAYNDAISSTNRLYKALSGFFNKYFEPHTPITPDHLLAGAGASPVLNQFFRSVADPDEGVLLVEPYYFAFETDLDAFSGVKVVPVHVPLEHLFTLKEIDRLEDALQESESLGRKIRGVILCNPHNPVGQCYPREVVLAYARFCEANDLHLLSDEIYALSVFPTKDKPNPQKFISALSFDFKKEGVHPSRVHVVYGMSKDFNANAFRIGVLISQHNPEIITSVLSTSIFMMVSSPSDILWSSILNDADFLAKFIKMNQQRLGETYDYITSWLKFHQVPYLPSNAGHYLMIDMRPALSDAGVSKTLSITADMDMKKREAALVGAFVKAKLFVASGTTYHMPDGGWLRFTFSLRRDYLNVALQRIEALLGWKKWDGYGDTLAN